MVQFHPFRALRPAPSAAERVASVPYDVVSTAEARELAAGNEDSFLHVVRPEIGFEADADPHAPAVYQRAAAALAQLIERQALIPDPDPAFYAYRQVWRGREQTGLVGCCAVDEYDDGTIRRHETTRPDKEDDRTNHALALSAHAGPVFLTYRGREEVDRRVGEAMAAGEPIYDFTAPDGVRHTVWKIAGVAADELSRCFRPVESVYVADGHHRSAAYSRARAQRRAASDGDRGSGEAGRFLSVLFPAEQLTILAYNRVVIDLAGEAPDRFLELLRRVVEVTEGGARPAAAGRVSMYLGGLWYNLRLPPERVEDPDPVACLDAAILQDLVLAPLLAIDDPRTSTRIEFVGGIRGVEELERRVDARPGGVAFSLHPVSVDQLMVVADAERVLPPKSTWFEPKLRSGLLIHTF